MTGTKTDTKRPSFWSQLLDDPATKGLFDSVTKVATAQAGNIAARATDKIAGKEGTGDGVGGAVQGVADAASQGKGKVGTLFGGVKGAVKGLISGPPGRRKAGRAANKRPTNIVEDVFIGAPVEFVFREWTRYEKLAGFMKGVVSVSRDDEDTTKWMAKVWWSKRSWKSKVVDQEPDHRIRWTAEAAKGTVEGVITFTSLGDNLTLMLVVVEYRGKGLVEWIGNRWRTAGRRIRLDLKHFRRHVMMANDSGDKDKDNKPAQGRTEDNGEVKIESPEPVKPVKAVKDADTDRAEAAAAAEAEAAGAPETKPEAGSSNGPRQPREPREPEPARGADR